MRPEQVIDEIVDTLDSSSLLSDEINYVDEEPATSSEHANVKLPIISLNIASVDLTNIFNTDADEVQTDADGNTTGIVFRSEYQMGVEIDVMTVAQSSFSRDTLGTDAWNTLYPYTDEGPSRELHPDVWMFQIDSEETIDDFGMTPTMRMWRMTCTVGSYTEFTTDESFVEDFNLGGPEVN